jgi:hypothetical protein
MRPGLAWRRRLRSQGWIDPVGVRASTVATLLIAPRRLVDRRHGRDRPTVHSVVRLGSQ